MLVPIVFAAHRAIAYNECRCIGCLAFFPEFYYVFMKRCNRHVVLDRGMAVEYHTHIMIEMRAALGNYFHSQFPCRNDHLLALVAPRLIVALHGKGAESFCAP